MSSKDNYFSKPPNGRRFSRLADCAGLGPVYIILHRRVHHRRHQAEGQVGCKRWLLECNHRAAVLWQQRRDDLVGAAVYALIRSGTGTHRGCGAFGGPA
jgi:hypothetical protein